MLAVLGAIVLTLLAGYIVWGALAMWWLMFAMGDYQIGFFVWNIVWTCGATAASILWWVWVGSHISVNFA